MADVKNVDPWDSPRKCIFLTVVDTVLQIMQYKCVDITSFCIFMSVVESLRCYIFNYLEKTTLIDHVKYKTQNISFHYKRRHSIHSFLKSALQTLIWANQTTGEFKPFMVWIQKQFENNVQGRPFKKVGQQWLVLLIK